MTSISQIPSIIRRAVRTGTNVHFCGNPGIGKTSIIEQAVKQIQETNKKFKLWQMYTPAMTPLDFSAVVPDMKTKQLITMHNTRLPNAYDDPDVEGLVFLGESWNADQDTNKCLQKYINNEDMGGFRKPANVIVVSDSNDISHRSGVVAQSLALLSRSRIITVHCDSRSTLAHFESIGVESSVLAFLSIRQDLIDNFEEVLKKKHHSAWANPRSWVRVSNAIIDAEKHKEALEDDEIIGDIGEAVGREFIAFRAAMKQLVKYEEVIASPEDAAVPPAVADQYAVIAMLSEAVKFKDTQRVFKYLDRYTQELQVLFIQLVSKSRNADKRKVTESGLFVEWIKSKPELIDLVIRG